MNNLLGDLNHEQNGVSGNLCTPNRANRSSPLHKTLHTCPILCIPIELSSVRTMRLDIILLLHLLNPWEDIGIRRIYIPGPQVLVARQDPLHDTEAIQLRHNRQMPLKCCSRIHMLKWNHREAARMGQFLLECDQVHTTQQVTGRRGNSREGMSSNMHTTAAWDIPILRRPMTITWDSTCVAPLLVLVPIWNIIVVATLVTHVTCATRAMFHTTLMLAITTVTLEGNFNNGLTCYSANNEIRLAHEQACRSKDLQIPDIPHLHRQNVVMRDRDLILRNTCITLLT